MTRSWVSRNWRMVSKYSEITEESAVRRSSMGRSFFLHAFIDESEDGSRRTAPGRPLMWVASARAIWTLGADGGATVLAAGD